MGRDPRAREAPSATDSWPNRDPRVAFTRDRQGRDPSLDRAKPGSSCADAIAKRLAKPPWPHRRFSAPVIDDVRQMMLAYRTCTRCVMDTSDPDIRFDGNGVCSH